MFFVQVFMKLYCHATELGHCQYISHREVGFSKPSSWKGNNDSGIKVSAQSAHSLISTLGAQDYEVVLDLL